MDGFLQKLKKVVCIMLYRPAISESGCMKAGLYQLPLIITIHEPGYSVRTRKYEVRSFLYGPNLREPCVKVRALYFQYGPSNLVSKSFIIWHHFSNKNDFFARSTHCMVRGSNVYESFVRYSSVRK